MENNQHIKIDIGQLRRMLFLYVTRPEASGPTNTVIEEALSSLVKKSLKYIPEKKHTKIEALVDTFLKENLKRTFSTFSEAAREHCVVKPEDLEILVKELTAEAPTKQSDSSAGAVYTLKRESTYEDYFNAHREKIEVCKTHIKAQKLVNIHCEKIFQSKGIKKIDEIKPQLELALEKDKARLKGFTKTLENLLKEEKTLISLDIHAKKKEIRTGETISDVEKYTLDRIVEKVRAHLSNNQHKQSIYFGLEEVIRFRKRMTGSDRMFMEESCLIYGENGFFDKKRLETEREARYRTMSLADFYEEMNGPVENTSDKFFKYIKGLIDMNAASVIMEMAYKIKSKAETVQGPEREEIEKIMQEMMEFMYMINIIHLALFSDLYWIHNSFQVKDSLENGFSAWMKGNFRFFPDKFKKIVAGFPNVEINSGIGKEYHALISYAGKYNERARWIHRNAMKAEEYLAFLRVNDAGEPRMEWTSRILEYDKFSTKSFVPECSGSIEKTSPESLEYEVTPREVKGMILSQNLFRDMYIEELGDKAKTESERVELKKSLSKTEKTIQLLNKKLLSFGKLSKEEAQKKEECLRYACLQKYKYECMKRIEMLKKEAEAEITRRAKDIMEKIEEIPNNPKLVEKAKKLLEKTLENEPHRLMTPEFFLEAVPFLDELPDLMNKLDEEIVKALKETSDEGTDGKRQQYITLQNSIFMLFFILTLLSLGLLYNSGTV
ncbi:uncharacterized protein NEMAJ01_1013 [Nematocida major]|uniref:uncharacterized protein n=1 Tax=Nematocida major TaxID=1912982 RepID=UPI002007C987|nr:uncharacterized protein NEMAJ01_1013 [Nematocida major]KAH9386117.1 hypothetical protein NEMAJ01_1013 [Nematocida major]